MRGKLNKNRRPKTTAMLKHINKSVPKPQKVLGGFKSLWGKEEPSLDESITITNALIASIGEGLIIVDEYGDISHINQPALDILGFDESELLGKWLPSTVPSFDNEGNLILASERPVVKALLTGNPVAGIVNYKRKDGSMVPVFGTSSPFLINGQPRGSIIVFRDISMEMQIERAKDEFVSLASHQLRTPLTSIRFLTELLKDPGYGKMSKKQLNYLDKILFSTDRMISLVTELLNVSKLNLGQLDIKPQPTNINSLVQNAVIETQPLAKNGGVKLSFESSVNKSEMVMLDRTLLAQIVHNLITNAIRYTEPKKRGAVKLSLSKNKKGYELSISDNGIGIPTEAGSHIYERFFRADNAVKAHSEGTGLGLYLVKAITEAAGGKIWYESLQNKGTTFYISIPSDGMVSGS
jgi:PAS domain S-box-containing protein